MSRPEVCVLKTDGVNCDEETMHAFEAGGGSPDLVHVNQLRAGDRHLKNYGVLALAGGFSYGDDIASGKVLANELTSYLSEQLEGFVGDEKPIIGICNGFQVLVRTGLLPGADLGDQRLTLATNDSDRFECRWVNLTMPDSVSLFVRPEDFDMAAVPMQVAHKEGKLIAPPSEITRLAADRQVVFRYSTERGTPTDTYPHNPNGSMGDIAGITDSSGLILGMMPHPERSMQAFPPNHSQAALARHAGESIFKNIVAYAKEM